MKALGNLIMTLSLIAGVLAAATSYFVSVDLKAEAFEGLTLGADAGGYNPNVDANTALHKQVEQMHKLIDEQMLAEKQDPLLPLEPDIELSEEERAVPDILTQLTATEILGEREASDPIGRPDDPITPKMLELLQAQADQGSSIKLKVKQFGFMRWSHNWVFGLAVLGLLGGAALVRTAEKKAVEIVITSTSGEITEEQAAKDPGAILASARITATDLKDGLKLIPTPEGRMAEILHHFGALQREEMMDFVACRPSLVAKYGLSGFAMLMDQFSAAERQVNRAWSAAADGVEVEAIACLEMSEKLFIETEEKLKSLKG